MRGIFIKGFMAAMFVGVIYFFGKIIVYDLLVPIFRPSIVSLIGRTDEYLIIILTVVSTIKSSF